MITEKTCKKQTVRGFDSLFNAGRRYFETIGKDGAKEKKEFAKTQLISEIEETVT